MFHKPRRTKTGDLPMVHPVNQQRMQTPYRPPAFEWEKERRELEGCIKQHIVQKEHAAGLLLQLAEERQGEIVVRLRDIARGLMQ